jgi:acylphosphatase
MSDQSSQRSARRFEILGPVQGVGYRYHVRAAATASGITGWIRMLPNGKIEVHAEGSPDQLQGFRASLQEGSNYAGKLKIEERPANSEQCTRFEIRH